MGRDYDRYKQDQNPLGAIIGGIIGVPLSSIIWALVISFYKLNINILAIAVGFIVGYMVMIMGRGVTTIYGVIGVFFTILGCITGRLLSIIVLDSAESIAPITEQILSLNIDTASYYLESTFEITDTIFYLIALIAGYYCSFRK